VRVLIDEEVLERGSSLKQGVTATGILGEHPESDYS
jgi:hypothetical protein